METTSNVFGIGRREDMVFVQVQATQAGPEYEKWVVASTEE